METQFFKAPADRDESKATDEERLGLPEGFASFNWCHDHLCVDVPDGGFTISARTSQGKRITFNFGVYKEGGQPQFVDVQYHDEGTSVSNGRNEVPTFDAIVFGMGNTFHNTRANPKDSPSKGKATIVCILMEDPKEGDA